METDMKRLSVLRNLLSRKKRKKKKKRYSKIKNLIPFGLTEYHDLHLPLPATLNLQTAQPRTATREHTGISSARNKTKHLLSLYSYQSTA